ncbi:MAG: hypothetical protein JXQ89_23030, partial [Pelagimonas sp.]
SNPTPATKFPLSLAQNKSANPSRIAKSSAKLENFRRVAIREDCCLKVLVTAIALAAIVIYWLWVASTRWIVLTKGSFTSGHRDGSNSYLF